MTDHGPFSINTSLGGSLISIILHFSSRKLVLENFAKQNPVLASSNRKQIPMTNKKRWTRDFIDEISRKKTWSKKKLAFFRRENYLISSDFPLRKCFLIL